MSHAGAGMRGLLTADACHFAGSVLDSACSSVYEELTAHSTNLSSAADQYHQTDEELGRRLRKIADDR
jgi:hypothetical protein